MRRFIRCVLLLGISSSLSLATVRLPQILSSHAVLQRHQPMHVWGWADAGEKVSVTFEGHTVAAMANRLGHWSVFLPPHSAGGPFTMTVSGVNELRLDDLLVGDVWFASGQSNMEMPLNGFPGSAVVKDAAKEISAADHPDMRLLLVPKRASLYPLEEFADTIAWTRCTPETAGKFSAVAYFFGREIAAAEHVPIGLIDSTWGGTPAEAWTSMEGLATDASLMPLFGAFGRMSNEEAELEATKKANQREDEAARQAHRPPPAHGWRGDLVSYAPSWLFNGMVAAATGYPIKGVIWYQGEANTDLTRAPLYAKLFSMLIADWRAHWQQGNFPFFFVQLANYAAGPSDGWPLVREAQRQTLQLVNTGMAVTIDIGEPQNIHPANKQAVGARLARAARAVAYGENIQYAGPLYQRVSTEGATLRVWFHGADGALQVEGDSPLRGFEIAGEDRRFVPANAKIDGANVLVSSPQVQQPEYVRYGWQSAPMVNLTDSAGLPASPFTSEEPGTLR